MGFEVFERPKHYQGRRAETGPVVGVQKAGMLSLNSVAYEAMGEPEAVILLFDPAERVVGLKPSTATDPRAFPVRSYTGRQSAKLGTKLVAARGFLKHYSVDHSEACRYPARMQEGILVVPLNEEESRLRAVS